MMFLFAPVGWCYSPAIFALITQVVLREAYANSSAWNSTFWHIGVVAGSAGGGIMLSVIGKNASYVVVLILILISVIQMWRIPKQPIQGSIKTETMSESIKEGLRFVFKNQPVFGALTLDLIAVLFG